MQKALGLRTVQLNILEDVGEGLGFKLTKTLWDPYPWVREVKPESLASASGLKAGDCFICIDDTDVLGMSIGQIAKLIRGDGNERTVTFTLWNCGTDPKDDPELLWSAGGGHSGERVRAAWGGALRALACVVCGSTAPPGARQCTRGHLYCTACRMRVQKCALCRDTMPALDSPQSKNLTAEQVFESIARAYGIKEAKSSFIKCNKNLTAPNFKNSDPTLNRTYKLYRNALENSSQTNLNQNSIEIKSNLEQKSHHSNSISSDSLNKETCVCYGSRDRVIGSDGIRSANSVCCLNRLLSFDSCIKSKSQITLNTSISGTMEQQRSLQEDDTAKMFYLSQPLFLVAPCKHSEIN